jgi:hypothetical protein
VAPQYFIRECLAYRSPPVDALKAMDEIVLSSNSVVSGGSPMNSVGVLRGAINRALVDLSSEELNRLTERLSEIDMSKVGRNIGNVFRRLVAERIQQLNKALENKYLLPQPLNIGPQN